MPDQTSKTDSAQVEIFVQMLGEHQLSLFRYIFALVPNIQDAEDIMQEVSRLLWQKFSEFELGSNFLAWSRRVAYFRIMEFRRSTDRRLQILPDDLLEAIAERVDASRDSRQDDRQHALTACFEKLRPNDRVLIKARYTPGINIAELATRHGRPANSVYKSLGRIRQSLLACIERQINIANKGVG